MIASMPRTAARCGCVLALVALLLGGTGAASRAATRHAKHVPLVGINVSGVGSSPAIAAAAAIAQAHALHATVVRTELVWSMFEPTSPSAISSSELAYDDHLTADAAADKMRVIMLIDSSPCWASSAPPALLAACKPGTESTANAWPPSNPANYAEFLTFIAKRYGRRLVAIEIWNEPDQANELYFAGPEKVRRYALLLRAAYPAIKKADPTLTVIAGSLVGSNGAFLNVCMPTASRAITTASRSTTTRSRWPPCERSTKTSSGTETQSRCGSTSSDGAPAIRGK